MASVGRGRNHGKGQMRETESRGKMTQRCNCSKLKRSEGTVTLIIAKEMMK